MATTPTNTRVRRPLDRDGRMDDINGAIRAAKDCRDSCAGKDWTRSKIESAIALLREARHEIAGSAPTSRRQRLARRQ